MIISNDNEAYAAANATNSRSLDITNALKKFLSLSPSGPFSWVDGKFTVVTPNPKTRSIPGPMIVACVDNSRVKEGLEVVCGVVSTLEPGGVQSWSTWSH